MEKTVQARRLVPDEAEEFAVPRQVRRSGGVVVIGLGRFGSSLARELTRTGTEVLGIDRDARTVQDLSLQLAHTAIADGTDRDSLEQLGVADFEHAVVAMATNREASVLAVQLLADFNVPEIWAKAISRAHERILHRVGANHIVLPEHEMGRRVAHLVTGRMLHYIEFEDDFAVVETRPPAHVIDKPLAGSDIRRTYGVTVVSIKRPGEGFTHATASTVIRKEDVLIVVGKTAQAEIFAGLA